MALLPYRLRSMLVWLRRCLHSRGFGVQSPWAYQFIRYVINEHYPYYEYSRLAGSVRGIDRRTRKLCRLYFRIANFWQPDTAVSLAPGAEAFAAYVKAGCKKTEVVDMEGCGNAATPVRNTGNGAAIFRVSATVDCRAFVEAVIDKADAGTLLIVEGINRNRESRRFWKELAADGRTGVTFDLYYCGIVFFDKKLYKQNYIVNF